MDKMCLHAAPTSKLCAMSRDILDEQAIKSLIRAEDFESFLRIAKKYPLFAQLPAEANDAHAVSEYLQKRFEQQVEKIEHFYPLNYKRFFRRIRDRFLAEDVKWIIRRRGVAALWQEGLSADEQRLVREARIHPDNTPFQAEMMLDQSYYQHLARVTAKLNASDRKTAREIVGYDVDMKNLGFFLRAKQYYDMTPSLIFNYALGGGRSYQVNELFELSRMSLEELTAFVEKSPYAEVFRGDAAKENLRLEKKLLTAIRRLKAEHPVGIITFIMFLHEWEYQFRDLVTIMEGKDYHLDVQDLLLRKLV